MSHQGLPHPVFINPDWPAPANIRAATSTRLGGVSHLEYASFNLGGHVGDSASAVATNREILQEVLSLPEQPLWLTQVHGVRVMRRDGRAETTFPREFDACYSNQPDTVCAVLTADCLPVLFCSRDGSEVAAAHAGWRGLVDGVLPATLREFAGDRSGIMAWLGPAIGPHSFEVGSDVRDRFVSQWQAYGSQQVADCFAAAGEQHWLCDLYALARLQLNAEGIGMIYGGGEDTCADWQRFYSFRRDGDTGRMVSLVWRTA
ncbi:MAG TPA: peptidoglycan editing factor PgeF [Pseudomonadales bacterium]|nr:peptidoglycan editing factor PgeF [Pseudomonadales bacterium]